MPADVIDMANWRRRWRDGPATTRSDVLAVDEAGPPLTPADCMADAVAAYLELEAVKAQPDSATALAEYVALQSLYFGYSVED